ncbi:putative selenate reductase, YgfK subunit [Acididesulfobacillus acetoxydans]|uniref:Selenate reductase, YgfK subunit n=1 Tax=Acididesulfobacillus acetoxydans TaxID=1561005 RepID=A0A8S0Y4I8_9FIRM|nr:putative selenate reductase subunit YgfK [Acididesulfobacillus acetoxydans]CAA7602995.1 putative selenate reductase, YgfK subunit [Acididesulfobacillus acetoxydans]CEJ05877.1 Sulfide dehydrogenase subunit alpha [Acididesulfobacillus acetoxydans]
MSDIMRPIPFKKLVRWVLAEYRQRQTIFGVPEGKFFRPALHKTMNLFGAPLASPVGPAAGPNTQLAQNIAAAYLAGGRFFELKTVQILDRLEFPKPCIKAEDECYNTEWSTELSIEGAFAEYVKAWFLLHMLQKEILRQPGPNFLFNMSVGYDLKGIQSPKVDGFIEGLKEASGTEIFRECRQVLLDEVAEGNLTRVDRAFVETIPSSLCQSITLSTMHGCPPAEIEAIAGYLLKEKKLNTLVKMNPTLLGYTFVRQTFDRMGYGYIKLKEESFSHDLQYADGVAMLKRLKEAARREGRGFGVKLSNTLPARITRGELPGEEMYMSGRALYPLTINLASKLAQEFNGDLLISYSGGADFFNVKEIFAAGIRPITVATTLLKPGGYMRLQQMAQDLEVLLDEGEAGRIDLGKLKALADSAFETAHHRKESRAGQSRKSGRKQLGLTDCFAAPCTLGCPIEQDVPEYIRLIGEGRFEEAYGVIVRRNPLPFITGTICNHNCMTQCTRQDYDESIRIRALKLLASERGFAGYMAKMSGGGKMSVPVGSAHVPAAGSGATPAKVAVIGAGPSGLAAAYFLAQAGLEVTVFDKREKAGGTVAYVIPGFRISAEAIERDLDLIAQTGVRFRLGVSPDFSIEALRGEGYDYIYLAIGAGKPGTLSLEGESGGIRGAIEFLEEFKRGQGTLTLGRHVAVIGGGNSAMDAARAALRVPGVEKVSIVYRRTRAYMPADREELELALAEGVVFKELLSPVSLRGGMLHCQVMVLGEEDASGRRSPLPEAGRFEDIPADTVLTAIGEQVDRELLVKNGIALDAKGGVQVDPMTLKTNLEHVYLGGDALYGPSTVVESIAHGTRAAKAILAELGFDQAPEVGVGEDAGEKTVAGFGRSGARDSTGAPATVITEGQRAEIAAKKGVLQTFAGLEQEPGRCLECQAVCNVCTEVCPNRANIAVQVSAPGLKNTNQIIHIDGMCNECGNCATFCPTAGDPYKDKLTLFWSDEDFNNSKNSGFLLRSGGEAPSFKVRIGGDVREVRFDEKGGRSGLSEDVAAMIWAAYRNYPYLF